MSALDVAENGFSTCLILPHGPKGKSVPDEPTHQQDGRLIELGANESIRIPLYTEQLFIEKRPVVAEEIIVSKRNIEEIRRFTDTVQREEARLERQGNVTIQRDSIEEVSPQN